MCMYVYDPELEPEPEPYSDKMSEPEPSSNFLVPQPWFLEQCLANLICSRFCSLQWCLFDWLYFWNAARNQNCTAPPLLGHNLGSSSNSRRGQHERIVYLIFNNNLHEIRLEKTVVIHFWLFSVIWANFSEVTTVLFPKRMDMGQYVSAWQHNIINVYKR